MPVFMAFAGGDEISDNEKNRAFFDRLPAEQKVLHEYPGAVHIIEFSTERDAFFADLGKWLSVNEGPL